MRHVLVLSIVAIVLASCAKSERQAEAPASAPADERAASHEHCVGYGTDQSACTSDPRCLPFLVPACAKCDGGQVHCMACLDLVELEGVPREACALRAEGRSVEACRLMHPDRPERCRH